MAERKNTKSQTVSRRAVLGAATAMSVLGPTAARANVSENRTYETVPLAKDSIDYACVQHAAMPVDPTNPRPGINRNLKRMVMLLDEHAHWAGPADLLSFSPFPLTGHAVWGRDEMRKIAVDLPGPETQVLAAKAREYNMWLTFSCYACDDAGPDHALHLGVVMSPDGDIVAKHWMTPPTEDMLPRYVEIYGWEEMFPITHTPVGSISMIGAPHDPRVLEAISARGGELCIHHADAVNPATAPLIASGDTTPFTSVIANGRTRNTVVPTRDSSVTQIIGPSGTHLAKAMSAHEEIVRATLPMAECRKAWHAPRAI